MQVRAKADPHLLVRPTGPHLGAAGLPPPSFVPLRISGEAWVTYRLSLHFLKAIHSGHLSMFMLVLLSPLLSEREGFPVCSAACQVP